jgi:hypothetical protein
MSREDEPLTYRRLLDRIDFDREPCCSDAEIVPCVCRISVRCPRHGLICIGSHD